MKVVVRPADRRDARDIARIRVETWRAAYAGLISDDILASLDAEREGGRREELWEQFHSDPRTAELIAHVDGELAGWAALGPSRDEDLAADGQVFAIYALPSHWGYGVGHALLEAGEEFLRRAGFAQAHLWVLQGNDRAATFYERHGWIEDGATLLDDSLVRGHAPLAERRRVKLLGLAPT